MRVLAYLRVSTEEQAEEGFSIPAQRQRVADFCRSQWGGAAAVSWYVDEGQSARKLDRPALSRLRAEAAPGDVVMVLRLDRLTRSVLDLYTLLKEWEERSVFFRSVTEPYDTTSTEGRFMIGLLALLAEWERLRIAERVREVMVHTVRQERRHLSRPPLGYRLSGGRLVVEEREAALVRELFRRYAAGEGRRAIAAALNRRGLRTKQGREWTDFTVGYILRNPVYRGKVAWGRIIQRGRRNPVEPVVVAGEHPPLVDEETWQRVRERAARQGRSSPRAGSAIHPLSGIARCGLCGAPIHGLTQRRGSRQERCYYRCANRQRKGGCSLPYLPAPWVEEQVLKQLSPLGDRPSLEAVASRLLASGPAGEGALAAEQQELRRRLQRWDRAYEAGDLSREEWRARTAPLRRRQQELERLQRPGAEGRALPTPARLSERLADLPSLWRWLTPEERRAVIRGLASRIDLGPESVRVTPHPAVAPPPAKGTP